MIGVLGANCYYSEYDPVIFGSLNPFLPNYNYFVSNKNHTTIYKRSMLPFGSWTVFTVYNFVCWFFFSFVISVITSNNNSMSLSINFHLVSVALFVIVVLVMCCEHNYYHWKIKTLLHRVVRRDILLLSVCCCCLFCLIQLDSAVSNGTNYLYSNK